MEKPPRVLEYLCLSCGAQGLAEVREDAAGISGREEWFDWRFRCPKCGGVVLCLDREFPVRENAPVVETIS